MMKHLGTQVLTTERLILRPFTMADAQAVYHNWANDSEVTKYLTWPTHESIAISQAVLADWVARYSEPTWYQWAIVPNAVGEPIGSISVVHMDDKVDSVHIGYCIGKKWWGQGIATEALGALIRFFFEEVKANRIDSRHDPRNPGSGKVMMHCGMKYEGTMRQADRNNQGLCDYMAYAILASEYPNR